MLLCQSISIVNKNMIGQFRIYNYYRENKWYYVIMDVTFFTLHISTWLLIAAMCRGHRPSLFDASVASGLWTKSHLTKSFLPECTASCNGKSPRWFLSHKFAPLLAKTFIVSNWPFPAPQWQQLKIYTFICRFVVCKFKKT